MYVDKHGKRIPSKYDNEPVYFCKHCLSLDIRTMDDYDYCNRCGSMSIDSDNIEQWEMLYKLRYGKKLLSK